MNKNVFIYQNAFSQTGGIQTFNKYFILALEELSSKKINISTELVGIYDEEKDVKTILPFTTLDSSKIKAFIYIFKYAQKFNTFIFAHVNLAPLAIALHVLNPKAHILFCTHGIEVWEKLPKATEWIMNKSTVLTVSNFSMNELQKYNPALKDIRLFPNCIKLQDKQKQFENPFDINDFNLLSVTRLSSSERLKGIDSVIKTLPILKNKIPHVKYYVIGKGDDVMRLKKLAKDLGVANYVNFLGFVDDIDAYYQHCDIFSLPSKKEGFGIVYLEAMHYKKPVIAVNYGGSMDAVIDGESGYLCEYDDQKCLAEKLLTLYEDPKLGEKLGQNGYYKLMNNFTFEHFKQRLKKILT